MPWKHAANPLISLAAVRRAGRCSRTIRAGVAHMLRTPRMETAIRCRGLVKRYGALTAVDGVDLEIARGECFGLLGPNGAGKTTTMEILEGLLAPTAGDVEILGTSWT